MAKETVHIVQSDIHGRGKALKAEQQERRGGAAHMSRREERQPAR
jgi:hypothetical protein